MSDEPTKAQYQLRDLMHALSESIFSAGWYVDLEMYLWGYAIGERPRAGLSDVDACALDVLPTLADACGVWWVWPDECAAPGPVRMPIAEWREKYPEVLAMHRAQMRELRRGERRKTKA